jgi:iron complex outermembrane receptor protein
MQKFYMFFKCSLVLMLVFLANAAFAQITVTGTVTDDVGPLPNVSVVIVGQSSGTQTNTSGKFSISVAKGAVLRFSAVGFKTRQVTVGDETTVNIKMAEDNSQLNEVVVTAFGIKREAKALGYASSTVSAKELTEAGNTNLASALYGKAAGVKINTSPGGASSAVNVQIRGINSINYNSQPLYVVDGVILRNNTNGNSAGGANNGGFYDDQRVRGNGILDVNPEDIESLTVLKGASATALYGSDATAGVIVITTKKGTKGKGLGIDFNYYGTIENAAFLPDYQNVYGQGYDRETNISVGASADGTFPDAASPAGWRPNFRAYNMFGPKMEGQQVRWWDGTIRSYSAQPDNYKNIFQTGYSSLANVSISNQSDKLDYRLSASRLDYNGIQRESNQKKNTFALNSTVKISPKVSIDLIANYVNTITHNRPYLTNRLAASFDGFFGRQEDTNLILEKFQTSEGYKWVPFNQTNRNPAEAFVFNVRPNLYDYFWSTQKNTYDEVENRLYTSASLNWDVVKNLRFRGRVGNDYTSKNIEDRQFNEYPTAFNVGTVSTGSYGVTKGLYSIVYADALLTYSNKIATDLNFSASGGFTTRKERYNDQATSTRDGLVIENFFSLSNSTGVLNATSSRQELTKYGYFGILNLNYKDYLFLEGTARQESASTLPVENNTYFYPSVNAGFVWSDAFKASMPSFLSFGKLRASYGVVGNPASIYSSNILYTLRSLQTANGSVPQSQIDDSYGNSTLKPEKKYEKEIGIETRMFNNRFGFDLTYYDNRIKNIILDLTVAPSVGARSQIVNIGEIGNKGWELAMNGTPLTGAFRWDVRANVALNTTKAYSLGNNAKEIGVYSAESGAVKVVVTEGEKLGTILVNPLLRNASGQNVIDADGFHVVDGTRYVKAGQVQPGVTGGIANTFGYKAFSLNVMVDYRFGGQLVSSPQKYALGAGMYKSTLKYRDTENGGLSYYVNAAGANVQLPSNQNAGPNGETVYHDGLILPGVLANGQPNTKIIDAASFYANEYAASGTSNNEEGAIYDNSFVKLREVTLGYTLPANFSKKIGMTNLRISLIGRNLLYFWKTLKNLDPETMVGSQWYKQGVDEGSLPATRSYGFSINAKF